MRSCSMRRKSKTWNVIKGVSYDKPGEIKYKNHVQPSALQVENEHT